MQEVVSGIIRNNNNEFLVFYHKKLNKLAIPVGKVEIGELPKHALIRELKEELNIDVNPNYIAKITETPTISENTKWLLHSYYIRVYTGTVHNNEPDKHDEPYWENIEMLLTYHETYISYALKMLRESYMCLDEMVKHRTYHNG